NMTYGVEKAYDSNGNRLIPHEDGNNRGDFKHWISAASWEYFKEDVLPVQGGNYYHADTPGVFVKYYTSTYSTASPLKVGVSNYNLSFYMRAVRVRKYASSEPSASVGSEEAGSWSMQ
ncbi:MAG TPA: hypothetical protein PLJ26_06235, partial [Candidatus Omnitrophota bacterium]|nr:hypothetical protein [Candidatus Omnitrophota bacterium]